jgi:hypothetical protein
MKDKALNAEEYINERGDKEMILRMNTVLVVLTFILVLMNTIKIEAVETKIDIISDELSYVSSVSVDQKRELERLVISIAN